MKKILLLILFLLFSSRPVLAQAFDAQRAYDDYVYNFNQYRQSLTEYQQARNAYLNYQTETSRREAFAKTQTLLEKRATAIWTYLTAIRQKLAETTGITNYKLNVLYLKLDDEIYWFQNHSEKYQAATDLDTLFSLNQEADEHYQKQTKSFAYQGLSLILIGKENNFQTTVDELSESLTEFSTTSFQATERKQQRVNNSLQDAISKLEQSREQTEAGETQVSTLQAKKDRVSSVFKQVKELTQASHQVLQQSVTFLKQAIHEITHL